MSYASLVDIPFKSQYRTNPNDGASVVGEFYIPVLSVARRYDRLSGYFSTASLCLSAKGIAAMIANGGEMRLVCSPNLSGEDARLLEVLATGKDDDGVLSRYIGANFPPSATDIEHDHLAAFGWLYSHGLVSIRLAVIDKEQSMCDNLCHPKIGIVEDFDGNVISFSGSNNETVGGWAANQEEFKVFKGWVENGRDYLQEDKWCFESYWEDKMPGVRSYDLPTAFEKRLIQASSSFDKERYLAKYYVGELSKLGVRRRLTLRSYQKDAIAMWCDNDHKLLLEMATGSGKTKTAIGCINAMMELEEACCIVIAVPRIALCEQWRIEMAGCLARDVREVTANSSNSRWRKELAAYFSSASLGTTKKRFIVVYVSHATAASKDFLASIEYGMKFLPMMLVADEAHGLGARKLQKALVDGARYRVGLSATPARLFDDVGTKRIVNYFGDKSYVFTIGQALTAGYLSPYVYYPLVVSMTAREECEYDELTDRIRKLKAAYDNDPSDEIYLRLEKAMRDRSLIVAAATGKVVRLQELMKEKRDEISDHTIAFACPQNIQHVLDAYVDAGLTARRYTARESQEVRAGLLRAFANGDCAALVAMKCLDEGIDVPSAKCAVLVSSTTNPREYIQRIGRVIRRSPGKVVAMIYDFLVARKSSGEIVERDFNRGVYIAQYADNATSAYNVLYRKEK